MAKQYVGNDGKPVGELTVLSTYFRRKEETLSEFSAQCKALTPEAKSELAAGAAKELGWVEAPSTV